ncbi:MAG: hypothetical protein M1822_000477 [Bathelium mastoideum]|nr:MAG: hypothetical protein M1822_000477 [Bathelium mastoideum]
MQPRRAVDSGDGSFSHSRTASKKSISTDSSSKQHQHQTQAPASGKITIAYQPPAAFASSINVDKSQPEHLHEDGSQDSYSEPLPLDRDLNHIIAYYNRQDNQYRSFPVTPLETVHTVARGDDLASESAPSDAPILYSPNSAPRVRNANSVDRRLSSALSVFNPHRRPSPSSPHSAFHPPFRTRANPTPQPPTPLFGRRAGPLGRDPSYRAYAGLSLTPSDMISPAAAAQYFEDPRVIQTWGTATPSNADIEVGLAISPPPPHPGVRPMWSTKGTLERSPEQGEFGSGPPTTEGRAMTGTTAVTIASVPPDGGYLAWLQAIGIACVVFNCWGLNYVFGAQLAYYHKVLLAGHSLSQISWIGSMQFFILFLLGPVVGWLNDRGHFRILFHGGSVLLIAATFGMSFCTSYVALLFVQGVLMGIGMGCTFTSAVVIVGQYFQRNLGVAASIGAAGSSLGGIVYCAVFRKLINGESYAWVVSNHSFSSFNMTKSSGADLIRRRYGTWPSSACLLWQSRTSS